MDVLAKTGIGDTLFGGQMGYRFVLETLAEEWSDGDERDHRRAFAEEDRVAIQSQVLDFRRSWRGYMSEQLEEARAAGRRPQTKPGIYKHLKGELF
jgi:hypothetical protein